MEPISTAAVVKGVLAVAGTIAAGNEIYHSVTNWGDSGQRKKKEDYYKSQKFGSEPFSINPIATVQGVKGIQSIKPVMPIAPIVGVGDPRTTYRNQQYNYYTDPTQVNSLADVVFNQAGKTNVMSSWLHKYDLTGTVFDLPILRTIMVGVDYIANDYVKPAVTGKPLDIIMNVMHSGTESIETITGAQLVKGTVIERGNFLETFKNVYGIGEDGRKHYRYDIDNWMLRMGADVISDPLMWLTIGQTIAGAGVTKATERSVSTLVNEQAAKFGLKAGDDIAKKITSTITSMLKNPNYSLPEKLTRISIEMARLDAEIGAPLFSALFENITPSLEKEITTIMAGRLYHAVDSMENIRKGMGEILGHTKGLIRTGGLYAHPAFREGLHKPLQEYIKQRKQDIMKAVLDFTFKKPKKNITLSYITNEIATFEEDVKRTTKLGREKYKLPELHKITDRELIRIYRLTPGDTPAERFQNLMHQLSKSPDMRGEFSKVRNSKEFRKYVMDVIHNSSEQLDFAERNLRNPIALAQTRINKVTRPAKNNVEAVLLLEQELNKQGYTLVTGSKYRQGFVENFQAHIDADNIGSPTAQKHLDFILEFLDKNNITIDEARDIVLFFDPLVRKYSDGPLTLESIRETIQEYKELSFASIKTGSFKISERIKERLGNLLPTSRHLYSKPTENIFQTMIFIRKNMNKADAITYALADLYKSPEIEEALLGTLIRLKHLIMSDDFGDDRRIPQLYLDILGWEDSVKLPDNDTLKEHLIEYIDTLMLTNDLDSLEKLDELTSKVLDMVHQLERSHEYVDIFMNNITNTFKPIAPTVIGAPPQDIIPALTKQLDVFFKNVDNEKFEQLLKDGIIKSRYDIGGPETREALKKELLNTAEGIVFIIEELQTSVSETQEGEAALHQLYALLNITPKEVLSKEDIIELWTSFGELYNNILDQDPSEKVIEGLDSFQEEIMKAAESKEYILTDKKIQDFLAVLKEHKQNTTKEHSIDRLQSIKETLLNILPNAQGDIAEFDSLEKLRSFIIEEIDSDYLENYEKIQLQDLLDTISPGAAPELDEILIERLQAHGIPRATELVEELQYLDNLMTELNKKLNEYGHEEGKATLLHEVSAAYYGQLERIHILLLNINKGLIAKANAEGTSARSSIIETITTTIDDAMRAYERVDEAAVAKATGVLYKAKALNYHNRNLILHNLAEAKIGDESVLDIFASIAHNIRPGEEGSTVFGDVINILADGAPELEGLTEMDNVFITAKAIKKAAEATINYIQLRTDIAELPIWDALPEGSYHAIFDALENLAQKDPEALREITPKQIEDMIVERTSGRRYSGISKLENVIKRLGGISGESHAADVDVQDTAYVANEYQVVKKAGLKRGDRVFGFDTESTSASKKEAYFHDAEIVQFSGRYYEVDAFGRLVEDKKFDPVNFYARVSDAEYERAVRTGVIPQDVLEASAKSTMTSEDVAQAAFAHLNNPDVHIMGYNSSDFDVPFIQGIVKQGTPLARGHIDVFDYVRETHPMFEPERFAATQEAILMLTRRLEQYRLAQAKLKMPFIKLIDKDVVDLTYDFANSFEFAVNMRDGATQLGHYQYDLIQESLDSILAPKAGVSYEEGVGDVERVFSFPDAVRDVYINAKKMNLEYEQYMIDLESLKKTDLPYKTGNIMAIIHGWNGKEFVDEYIYSEFGVQTLVDPSLTPILKTELPKELPVPLETIHKMKRRLSQNYSFLNLDMEKVTPEFTTTIRDAVNELLNNEASIWKDSIDVNSLSPAKLVALYNTLRYNYRDNLLDERLTYFNNIDDLLETVKHSPISDYYTGSAASTITSEIKTQYINAHERYTDFTLSYEERQDALDEMLSIESDVDKAGLLYDIERTAHKPYKSVEEFDVEWYSNLLHNAHKRENKLFTQPVRDVVASYENLAPEERIIVRNIEDQIHINHARAIISADPASLQYYLRTASPQGFIIPRADRYNLAEEIQTLLDNKTELGRLGIIVHEDKFGSLQVALKKDALKIELATNEFTPGYKTAVEMPDNPRVLNYFKLRNKLFESTSEYADDTISMDSAYDSRLFGGKRDVERYLLKYGNVPDRISDQELYGFLKDNPHVRLPVLGSREGIQSLDLMYPTSSINSALRYAHNVNNKLSTRDRYLQIYFNNDLTLDASPMWHDLSNEEIADIVTEYKERLTVLALHDNKGRIEVREMLVKSAEDIARVKELRGIVVPKELGNMVYGTINAFNEKLKEEHPLLWLWHKNVVTTYKSIFLSVPGFPFRNTTDTLVKNMIESEQGLEATWKSPQYFFKAWKLWDNYSQQASEILASQGTISRNAIDAFFEAHPELDKELFLFIHNYATSAAGAGLSKTQEELIRAFASTSASKWQSFVWENPWTKMIMNVNSYVEHASRLGLMLQTRDNGFSVSEGVVKAIRAHFDYKNKSYGELLMETVMPFVVFPMRNLEFWASRLKESAYLTYWLQKMSLESLDFYEQTQFMLDNSSKLRSQIASGQVRGIDAVLKLNPSLQGALSLSLTPHAEAHNRLIPPVRWLVDNTMYGLKKLVGLDPKEPYRNGSVTDLEQFASDAGLYTFTRGFKYVREIPQVITGDAPPRRALPPSLFNLFTDKNGESLTHEDYILGKRVGDRRIYTRLPGGITLERIQGELSGRSKTKVKSFYPPKSRRTYYKRVGARAGYSTQRIPYTKRYYSPNYNFYNRWRAENAMRKNAMRALPATPESVARNVRNMKYQINAAARRRLLY